MYYYSLNIGDFALWTSGFDSESVGIFVQLLNRYLSTEKPIKTQWVSLGYRNDEKEKALTILSTLWEETADGWIFPPVVEIIQKYQQNASKNRANGQKGGRPRKNPNETQTKPIGFSTETQTEPNHNPNETLTNNQITNNQITNNREKKEVQEKPASRKSDDFRVSVFPKIVSKYNSILGDKLPKVSAQSDKRIEKCRKWANALYREKGCKSQDELLGEAEKFFRQVLRCPFLLGESGGDRHWRADFDFLMTEKGRIGVVEGKYLSTEKEASSFYKPVHDWEAEQQAYYEKQRQQEMSHAEAVTAYLQGGKA